MFHIPPQIPLDCQNIPQDEQLIDPVQANLVQYNNSNTNSLKPPTVILQPSSMLSSNTEQQQLQQMVASTARGSTDLFQQLLDEYRS